MKTMAFSVKIRCPSAFGFEKRFRVNRSQGTKTKTHVDFADPYIKIKKMSYTRARQCLLDRLKSVAPNLNLGLHSLRASGCTKAANENVNERYLKRHGRWKSDESRDGYIADSLDKKLDITKKLGF